MTTTISSSLPIEGRWTRRGATIVIDLQSGPKLGEVLEAGASFELTPQQLIDPRIDVFAQRALQRLSKNPATMADAFRMLKAVRSGVLGGIYKEDERVPALMARRGGTGWWEIIPPEEDAVLLLPAEGDPSPPVIVFRDRVRSDSARLDPALVKAGRGRVIVPLIVGKIVPRLAVP